MKEIIRKNIAGIWSSIPTPFTENLELDRACPILANDLIIREINLHWAC